MIEWQAITREALLARVAQGVARMEPAELRLWKMMRIDPVKWSQDPYGREGEGFWVVALIGSSVIWYNDIEDGFNRSHYETHGAIRDYWCNQDELDVAVKYLVNAMDHEADLVGMGTPQILWRSP
jgi:hypothetical protein